MSSGRDALHGTSLIFGGHVEGICSGSSVAIKFREPVSLRAIRLVPRGVAPHPNHMPDFMRYAAVVWWRRAVGGGEQRKVEEGSGRRRKAAEGGGIDSGTWADHLPVPMPPERRWGGVRFVLFVLSLDRV